MVTYIELDGEIVYKKRNVQEFCVVCAFAQLEKLLWEQSHSQSGLGKEVLQPDDQHNKYIVGEI